MSPTTSSLKLLRKSGWIATVVEQFIAKANIRRDCFGFADILAAHPRERRMMLVQTTSLANVSTRVKKIQGKPEAAAWLSSGGIIEVHGWTLRAGLWRVKRVEIRAADTAPIVIIRPPKRTRGAAAWQPARLF
jgi:hypothetical protein